MERISGMGPDYCQFLSEESLSLRIFVPGLFEVDDLVKLSNKAF